MFLRSLPLSDFANFPTSLSRQRDRELYASEWAPAGHLNSHDRLNHSSEIRSADGDVSVSAEVMTAMPCPMSSVVVTGAEVRAENLDAWASALRP